MAVVSTEARRKRSGGGGSRRRKSDLAVALTWSCPGKLRRRLAKVSEASRLGRSRIVNDALAAYLDALERRVAAADASDARAAS